MTSSRSAALIIDPTFPATWKNAPSSPSPKIRAPIVVRSAPEAVRYLSTTEVQFGAIYLNAVLTLPGVVSLIRMSHLIHTATPIFVLHDGVEPASCPFSAQELNRLAVQSVIVRQCPDEFFRKLLLPMIDLDSELKELPEAEAEGSASTESSEDFIAIPIHRFNSASKIFFDVHIRVSKEKFLKIHSAGSALSASQLLNYAKKGVTHLYFQKSSHQRCLDYCDLLQRTFLTNKGVSSAVKISVTLNRGQSTLDILKDSPKLRESQLDEILDFTNDVRRLLSQLSLDKSEDVQALIQNISIYDHSLGTTALALLFARPLKFEHEQSAEILGIASFLHDIGLSRMPPAVQSENPALMIGSHRELYLNHPITGAQILREANVVHPVAIQIVAQHHERRSGHGFPNRLIGDQIHKLAEVVGFSEEFARLLQARPGQPLSAVIKEMEKNSYEHFSLQMMEGFQSVVKKVL